MARTRSSLRRSTAALLAMALLAAPAVRAQEAITIDAANGFAVNLASEDGASALVTVDGDQRRCALTRDGEEVLRLYDCVPFGEGASEPLPPLDQDAAAVTGDPDMTLDQATRLLELMPPPAFDAAFSSFLRDQNCVIDFSNEDYADNLMLYSVLQKLGIPARHGEMLRDRVEQRAGDTIEGLPGARMDHESFTVYFEGVCS